MIIIRTPLRVSLFGGGTDFESYYKISGGEVVSFTIDRSIYVTVNKRFDGRLHLRYSKTEEVGDAKDLKHDIVKECLKYVGIDKGVELVIISDVPSVGTGLGSSGALTVGVLKALYEYIGKKVDNYELAQKACEIEIDKLGAPIGKQDQFAVAMGGFNYIQFKKNDTLVGDLITVNMLYDLHKEKIDRLLQRLMLFYIPNGRKSSKILKVYKKNIQSNRKVIDLNRSLVAEFLDCLDKDLVTAEKLGKMLDSAWKVKKESSPATNDLVDRAISIGLGNGGLGGKVCGAGSGGFMMLVAEKEDKDRVKDVMEKEGFRWLDFKFYNKGSEIIYRG